MTEAAESLRTGHRVRPPASLRAGQLALAERLGVRGRPASTESPAAPRPPTPDPGRPDPHVAVLVSETDLIANSVNTIGHLLADSGPGPR